MKARTQAVLALFAILVLFANSPVQGDSWESIAPLIQVRRLVSTTEVGGEGQSRFVQIPAEQSGINFTNRLDWDHPKGLLFNTGFACGGIAVGDVDGNGLPDLFFVSALGRNRLFLQQTKWRFVESAAAAGLPGNDSEPLGGDGWGTGAALFDIDNDGDLDLYVCNYDAPNTLYVNHGDGTFDERAAEYGLDVVDACLMPSVADYDRDGDLDIYLAVNRYLEEFSFRRNELFYWHDGAEHLRPSAEKYFAIRRHYAKGEQLNMWTGRKDYLLRNEGPGQKFTDVSKQMQLERGDCLSATWWDYDHDGWPDMYVGNDLAAPDQLFHNRRDGTFEDVTLKCLPHTPWLAMGASAGDVNNDGLVDFLIADMSFRTHFKDKTFMGDMTEKFRSKEFFPHDQRMRNALFINSGTSHFQEAAYLAGLASTDWTWSAKLADLDNDGRLDAFFTNGSPVNLANSSELEAPFNQSNHLDTSLIRKQYRELPPVLEQNLAFQNQGDLRFVDRSQEWGLDHVGMSFAAVHADLDRDGDLDLVVANLNEPPSIYRNDSFQQGIIIQLRGQQSNRNGIGAELTIDTKRGQQVQQVYPVSGFLSCHESLIHFGLGKESLVQRLTVRWPSGVLQTFEDLQAGNHYRIDEPAGEDAQQDNQQGTEKPSPAFESVVGALIAEHHELPFDDFVRQPLLPNKLSQLGPPLAWGDVDGDGDVDLFLGEGTEWMGMIYLNQGGLQFAVHPQVALARDASAEDSAAVFFDANGDGQLDLYVGSGSVECSTDDPVLRDRLYLGDGQGNFQRAPDGWLPDLRFSTGAVAVSDFDRDGDQDLVVCGRSIPGEYPLAPPHALLRNDGNRFVDVLAELAPELANAGMVTAAQWVDVDGDDWDDLVVATDWGPVRLYLNKQGRLVEATAASGLNQWTGWWQSLAVADVDNDGDVDLIAGNFGLNTKYHATAERPVLAFYGEYGDSGKNNFIEASYEGDVLFPIRGKSCSSSAMPHLAGRFKTYEAFAKATLSEIYTPRCLEQAIRFEVNTLASCCFLNDGEGRFTRKELPEAVQLAPVFAIAATEVNGDGKPDLFLGQNFFGPQKETGRHNGGLSVVATGQGDGTFVALRPDRAGVSITGDVKAAIAVDLDGQGQAELCVATNDGPLQLFRQRSKPGQPVPLSARTVPQAWPQKQLQLAQMFMKSGQSEAGLPYLRRALKMAPNDAQALLMLAVVRREQGRFDEAELLLDRLHGLEGIDEPRWHLEKGLLCISMKRFDQAEEFLLKASAARPGDRGAQLALGDLRLAQGRLDEARQYFQKAQRADRVATADQQIKIARIVFLQAQRAQRAGSEEKAIRLYDKSRRLHAVSQTQEQLAHLLENANDPQLRDPWMAAQLRLWSKE